MLPKWSEGVRTVAKRVVFALSATADKCASFGQCVSVGHDNAYSPAYAQGAAGDYFGFNLRKNVNNASVHSRDNFSVSLKKQGMANFCFADSRKLSVWRFFTLKKK